MAEAGSRPEMSGTTPPQSEELQHDEDKGRGTGSAEMEKAPAPIAVTEDESVEAETVMSPDITETRELLEAFFEKVNKMDPEHTQSLRHLEDRSKELHKLVSAIIATLKAGGAHASARSIVEGLAQNFDTHDHAHAFARLLTDSRRLASGTPEHDFYTHYMAGLKAQSAEQDRQAA